VPIREIHGFDEAKVRVGEGADANTRGRVCSPELQAETVFLLRVYTPIIYGPPGDCDPPEEICLRSRASAKSFDFLLAKDEISKQNNNSTMTRDLLSELGKRPMLCDGAMGTQLLIAGLGPGECGMLWNADAPAKVRDIHGAYRAGGCDLITSNTFGGASSVLARHGMEQRVGELNRAGAAIAREAAGEGGWVLGDVGPFGDFLEPLGDVTPAQLHAIFCEQMAALIAGGADAILVETMSDPAEVEVGVAAVRACGELPVVATYAFQKTGEGEYRTMMGTSVEEAVVRAVQAGAHVVGANCGTALTFPDYLELARQLVRAAGDTPVILQPNAGAPRLIDGNTVYLATPEEMAAIVRPLLDAGVRIVGGCCGTSPAHLAAMKPPLAQ